MYSNDNLLGTKPNQKTILIILSVVGLVLSLFYATSALASPDPALVGLGTFGGYSSYANAISADGSVVVGAADTASGVTHAFRWANGMMTDLGTFGGDNSYTLDVSADGSVVVGAASLPGNFEHAFRWANGTMKDLGTLEIGRAHV